MLAMLGKILLAAVVLALLYFGVGFVRYAFASDETRIRWLVEGMEEAYNAGRPGACVGPLAKDWHHDGYSIDREMLLGALFQMAHERDRETHELLSRVEVDARAMTIRIDGEHATLTTEAQFSRLRAGKWEVGWRLRIEAELVDGEDGWEIVESRHLDLAGTQLGR